MRKAILLDIKCFCDNIAHCGDYGESYVHNDLTELYIVLGDSDEVDFEEAEFLLTTLGIKFTVENEVYPDEDKYTLISRGVEAEYYFNSDSEGADEDEVNIDDGYIIPRHLSVEEYLVYINLYKNLKD